jgi:hypothetical protein
MKPVNFDNAACNPISSNCVIWQGPNIPIINLCKGDTISDVVFKLATELATVMEQLKVTNYDLSCFNITDCLPEDFIQLQQFLIEKICELQNINPDTVKSNECPDCVVTVAECFVDSLGTTANLVEYVNAIATKVCTLAQTVSDNQDTLNQFNIRITDLEDAPVVTYIPPTVSITCTATPIAQTAMNEVIMTFINNIWCGYYTLVGSTTQVNNAIAAQCLLGTDTSLTNAPLTLADAYPNWVTSATSMADIVTNAWIAICDIYGAVQDATNGIDGRGVAVFVGDYTATSGPTNADVASQYAGVPGFTVNALPGSADLKPGDIWIESC